MKRIRLSKYEKEIEEGIGKGVFVPVSGKEQAAIARALHMRKKNAVLNIRINENDLSCIKSKAKKLGLKYQTFIAEVLHSIAHT